MIAGGFAGTLLWPLGTWVVFGDPVYIHRRSWVTLTLANVPGSLPLYTMALLLFIPGGLLAGLLYRGERWPEVVATVAIFFGFYLSWGYRGEDSGLLRSLILGPRFFAPLTPLLAFAAAEAVPRLWAGFRARAGTGAAKAMERIAPLGVRLWVAGVLVVAFAVHPVLDRITERMSQFRKAIYDHSADGSVVVIPELEQELVKPMFGERLRFYFDDLTPETLDRLLARHGTIIVVLYDRRHSPYLRGLAAENQETLDSLARRAEFELLFDRGGDTAERLRIWRVSASP